MPPNPKLGLRTTFAPSCARQLLVAVASASLAVASAHAQVADDLTCRALKKHAIVKAEVDLAQLDPRLPSTAGCKVTGPVLLCSAAAATIVSSDPPAPGAPPGAQAGTRLCYRVTCSKSRIDPLQVTDAFGTHLLEPSGSRLLCTPALSYAWFVGAFSTCSAPCGGGTQVRSVTCVDENGQSVGDALCAEQPKPPAQQACNTDPCP